MNVMLCSSAATLTRLFNQRTYDIGLISEGFDGTATGWFLLISWSIVIIYNNWYIHSYLGNIVSEGHYLEVVQILPYVVVCLYKLRALISDRAWVKNLLAQRNFR